MRQMADVGTALRLPEELKLVSSCDYDSREVIFRYWESHPDQRAWN